MPRRSLRVVRFEDEELERFQAAVHEYTRQLDVVPWLDGVLRENIDFAGAGTTLVEHKLGRVPRGVRVEKWIQTAAGDPPRLTAAPDLATMSVAVSAACTVTFWVW